MIYMICWKKRQIIQNLIIHKENIFLVISNTPLVCIKNWKKLEIYMKNAHITLYYTYVSKGQIAIFSVETEELIYGKVKI